MKEVAERAKAIAGERAEVDEQLDRTLSALPNLPLASADIATGREPDLGAMSDRVGGVRFFYTDTSGRVVDTRLSGERPDWLTLLAWLVRPGEELDPLPARRHFARTGYAIVLADDPDECAERMTAVAGRHVLDLAPREGVAP